MKIKTTAHTALHALAFFVLALACLATPGALAQTAPNGTGGTGGAGPGAGSKGQDYDHTEHLVVAGLLQMRKEGDKKEEGEPENVVGKIMAADAVYKLTCAGEKLLADLQARDGKKISLEGKIDKKTNTIAVTKLTEGVLPPAEMRNPRGL